MSSNGKISMRLMIQYTILAAISAVLGRSWRMMISYLFPLSMDASTVHNEVREADSRGPFINVHSPQRNSRQENPVLFRQIKSQKEMQRWIEETQTPGDCGAARIMTVALEHPKDGFASEFQYVARLLQMAASTHRVLQFTAHWSSAYEPPHCRTDANLKSGWECLWEPVTKCPPPKYLNATSTMLDAQQQQQQQQQPLANTGMANPLLFGILERRTTSTFFDVAAYGPSRAIRSPTSFPRKRDPGDNMRPDVIPHWERVYGRFWVRAQMAHYLWKPNTELQQQIQARIPSELQSDTTIRIRPFIGFHIRYTDNIRDLHRHFSRNATATRSFSRYMEFATAIREQWYTTTQSKIRTIYLATDNTDVVRESQDPKWKNLGWTFLRQRDVQRSDSHGERLWFSSGRGSAAGAIATDLEVLRRADFLVGSFQSNVFRLAAELNSAWHVATYAVDTQRHWTVDIEWYEDP